MKILCTGNPTHATVASAVRQVFPESDFAARATGYDLRFWTPGSEKHFRESIINYNVFVNSSYICNGGQLMLLETTVEEWIKHNIKGMIFNIGSSAEWLGIDSKLGSYSIQKRALRDRGLQLHSKNGIKITHFCVGGLNDGNPGHESWLDLTKIADTIKWILTRDFCVPMIYLESDSNISATS